MICPRCQGALYADRRSIADAAFYGFRGGRIRCPQGCTSIWLTEFVGRTPTQPARPVTARRWQHEKRLVVCHDVLPSGQRCLVRFETRANNTIRCPRCRAEASRRKARQAHRRHQRGGPAVMSA